MLPVVSPEGTTVRFRLPSLSDRFAAFAIDLVLTQVATAAVVFVCLLFYLGGGEQFAFAVFLLASFFLRNVYFAFFELLWSGETVGKRKLGLKAIARDGGPLTGQAILARNLTRELEVFLPLVALNDPKRILPLAPGWGAAIALAWLAVFALLPVLNAERLRCGDLLGGTVVVRLPKHALLQDVVAAGPAPAALAFTPAQLGVYGIEELHVLEAILRRAADGGRGDLLDTVSGRIRKKIGWTAPGRVDAEAFLRAFYEAQRAHLERKMLFGVRKERKDG